MAPAVMTLEQTKPRRSHADRSAREIIQRARSRKESQAAYPAAGGAWLLSGLTALLMWGSFTPLDWGPLAWVCLVPLIQLVRIPQATRRMYRAVYLGGLLWSVATLQWMRLGDPAMYLAWWALAAYLALYFPVFVAVSRVGVQRLRLPMMLVVPVVWVGLEFARARLMTGFAWYFLGHTQYAWLELIQISDLIGAFGVSFVIAAAAACLAGAVPAAWLRRLRMLVEGAEPRGNCRLGHVLVCWLVVGAALGYGYSRRSQADFKAGPRVAMIQGNFPPSLKHPRTPAKMDEIYLTHLRLTGLAVRHQPDLIVWPESMFPWGLREVPDTMTDDDLRKIAPRVPLTAWRTPIVHDALTTDAQRAGAAMVVGVQTAVPTPEGVHEYNSAVFVRPDTGISGRYDKLHRVPFGEYLPLKDWAPWLYRFTPFPPDFGIEPGRAATAFDHRGWRFAPIICFEDTVPELVRGIVKSTSAGGQKPVDCLLNLTNDGWFHGSSELDQHLITAAFRCVECRTPMVRAVNTGISAVIDGDGTILEPEVFIDGDGKGRTRARDPRTGRWHRQLNAASLRTVPLDDRSSLYVQHGDWFAGACALLTAALLLCGAAARTWNGNSTARASSRTEA